MFYVNNFFLKNPVVWLIGLFFSFFWLVFFKAFVGFLEKNWFFIKRHFVGFLRNRFSLKPPQWHGFLLFLSGWCCVFVLHSSKQGDVSSHLRLSPLEILSFNTQEIRPCLKFKPDFLPWGTLHTQKGLSQTYVVSKNAFLRSIYTQGGDLSRTYVVSPLSLGDQCEQHTLVCGGLVSPLSFGDQAQLKFLKLKLKNSKLDRLKVFLWTAVIERLFPMAYADKPETTWVNPDAGAGAEAEQKTHDIGDERPCEDAVLVAQEATSGMNPEEIKMVGEASVEAASAAKIGSARAIHHGSAAVHGTVSAVTLARFQACSEAIDECITVCSECAQAEENCSEIPAGSTEKNKCKQDQKTACNSGEASCSGFESQCNSAAVSSILSAISAAQSFFAARQLGGCDKDDASCDKSLKKQIACEKNPSLPQCKNKRGNALKVPAPPPPAPASPTSFSSFNVAEPGGSKTPSKSDKPSPSPPKSILREGQLPTTETAPPLAGTRSNPSPSSSYTGLESGSLNSGAGEGALPSSALADSMYSPSSSGTAAGRGARRTASAQGKKMASSFFGLSEGPAGKRLKKRPPALRRRGQKTKKKDKDTKKAETKNIKQKVFKKTNPHDSVFERSSKIISSFCLQRLKCL